MSFLWFLLVFLAFLIQIACDVSPSLSDEQRTETNISKLRHTYTPN